MQHYAASTNMSRTLRRLAFGTTRLSTLPSCRNVVRRHHWHARPKHSNAVPLIERTVPYPSTLHSDLFSSRYLNSSSRIAMSSRQLHGNGIGPITPDRHDHDYDRSQAKSKGEDLYTLAMEALQKAENAKKSHEEMLLREQYDAMERQRQKTLQREKAREKQRETNPKLKKLDSVAQMGNSRDRAAGVAVVRTIVKQSQPKDVRVDQFTNENGDNDGDDNQNEEFWKKTAHQYMIEAACRYGHPSALVRLGNVALERAILQNNESTVPIIDEEQCKAWTDESPIDLHRLLLLRANVEDNQKVALDAQNVSNRHSKYLSPYQQLAACLYEEAGKQGSSEGWYNLGHLLWDNKDNEAEANESLKYEAFDAFLKSMEAGDSDALYFLAVQYLSHDDEDTSASATEHTAFLKKVHEKVGQQYTSFRPAKEDDSIMNVEPLELDDDLHQVGYGLLRRAALHHSHGPALHHLALLHHQINQKDDEFVKILSQAAATGHPESLFLQGHCFYHGSDGYGPKRDLKAAFDNFLAAAENGHIDAMVSAGAMLYSGVRSEDGTSYVVERDQERAFDLYQQAGELGSLEGWRNVVHCYATGQGVPQCLETAQHIAQTMLSNDENKT